MIALLAVPAASGLVPRSVLLLAATVDADGAGGVVRVSVTNGGSMALGAVYLEAEVPPGVAVQPDLGTIVGGVWRYVVNLAAGESAVATLSYQDVVRRTAATVWHFSAQSPGVPSVDLVTSLPASPPDLPAVAGMGLLAAVAILAFLAVRLPRAEQVFLVHRSGMLIGSRGRGLRDADLFSGMLIVVQQAIRRGLADPSAVLEEVRFRNRVLSLVHGDEALVATVSRSPAGGIQRRAAAALRDFESRNAGALRRWSGAPADLAGIQRVIARL